MDNRQKRIDLTSSILAKTATKAEIEDAQKAGLNAGSLQEVARGALARDGIQDAHTMPFDRVWRTFRNSVSSSELSNILADTLNKSIAAGYSIASSGWSNFTVLKNARNFQKQSFPVMSSFSDIVEIQKGAPIPHGILSDHKESAAIKVRGRALNIPMELFYNDDKDSLAQVPYHLGQAVAWDQAYQIMSMIHSNPSMGEDDMPCFHADHGNLAGTGAAPTKTTLGAARKAMRNQAAPKSHGSDSEKRLNLSMRHILVPSSQELAAESTLVGDGFDIEGHLDGYNPFSSQGNTPLTLTADATLDQFDTQAWYTICDPEELECIALLCLNGEPTPRVRSEDSKPGEALGVSFDVWYAAQPLILDYRGIYKNPGA